MHSTSRTIVGTGLIALDVILEDDQDESILAAGGTCGNVLIILAGWGWNAYPVARLGDDPGSRRVLEDLAACDVRLDVAQLEPRRPAPVFIERLRKDGSHRFSSRCPACKGWLPRYAPVTAASIREASPTLPEAETYFFDRVSRGALDLAALFSSAGALVFFEPSASASAKQLEEAARLADIAKYSTERFEHLLPDGTLPENLKLEIATMGGDGLRYRGHILEHPEVWRKSPAVALPAGQLRDAAGAGDWFTAALLQLLATEDLSSIGEAELAKAIATAQVVAAESVRFVGARGGMGHIRRPNSKHSDTTWTWSPPPAQPFQCGACAP